MNTLERIDEKSLIKSYCTEQLQIQIEEERELEACKTNFENFNKITKIIDFMQFDRRLKARVKEFLKINCDDFKKYLQEEIQEDQKGFSLDLIGIDIKNPVQIVDEETNTQKDQKNTKNNKNKSKIKWKIHQIQEKEMVRQVGSDTLSMETP